MDRSILADIVDNEIKKREKEYKPYDFKVEHNNEPYTNIKSEMVCPVCGKPFTLDKMFHRYAQRIKNKNYYYCSYPCAVEMDWTRRNFK